MMESSIRKLYIFNRHCKRGALGVITIPLCTIVYYSTFSTHGSHSLHRFNPIIIGATSAMFSFYRATLISTIFLYR